MGVRGRYYICYTLTRIYPSYALLLGMQWLNTRSRMYAHPVQEKDNLP